MLGYLLVHFLLHKENVAVSWVITSNFTSYMNQKSVTFMNVKFCNILVSISRLTLTNISYEAFLNIHIHLATRGATTSLWHLFSCLGLFFFSLHNKWAMNFQKAQPIKNFNCFNNWFYMVETTATIIKESN